MSKIKSIPKSDVEKLIAYIEKSEKRVNELFNEGNRHSASIALGYAEAVLGILTEKLKGEYPI